MNIMIGYLSTPCKHEFFGNDKRLPVHVLPINCFKVLHNIYLRHLLRKANMAMTNIVRIFYALITWSKHAKCFRNINPVKKSSTVVHVHDVVAPCKHHHPTLLREAYNKTVCCARNTRNPFASDRPTEPKSCKVPSFFDNVSGNVAI